MHLWGTKIAIENISAKHMLTEIPVTGTRISNQISRCLENPFTASSHPYLQSRDIEARLLEAQTVLEAVSTLPRKVAL